jgi:3-hydroxyisobutyryl-CoA hydrolase
MPLKAKITAGGIPNSLVKYWVNGGVGKILLDRANKLNALTHNMSISLLEQLDRWKDDSTVKAVLVEGAGQKSFCAGGDITESANQVGTNDPKVFSQMVDDFSEEFSLNHLVATFPKPYISIIDGICMGGGVGISIHGHFRIATERTKVAMPETRIGFFCDVGSSFFLSKMQGNLGRYLALTSDTLDGYDNFLTGVATHYIESKNLNSLYTKLNSLRLNGDEKENYQEIKTALDECCCSTPPQSYESKFGGEKAKIIDRCFGKQRVEEIVMDLQATKSDRGFVESTLITLNERSPTSLKVTLELLNRAKNDDWTIKKSLIQDASLSKVVLQLPDYVEGVNARLVSKPPRKPIWNPSDIPSVNDKTIAEIFQQIDKDVVPVNFRTDVDYNHYPWGFASRN